MLPAGQASEAKVPMMDPAQPVQQQMGAPKDIGQSSFNADESERPAKACGCCITCVPSGSVGLFEEAGSYSGIVEPGRACYCSPWSNIRMVSLATSNYMHPSMCKTKDNTLITVIVAVQFNIMRSRIKTAIYDTDAPMALLGGQIDSVLRTSVPRLTLDEVYAATKTITQQILGEVRGHMEARGYSITKVLITDVQPDPQIVRSMNQLNAERRQRDAAFDRGEAEKILQIAQAEANAEAMQKAGWGLKEMRKAMADGFSESVGQLAQSGGYSVDQAMHMMMAAQYLDTLKDFAESGKAAIVLPSGPGGVSEIQRQVAAGFMDHAKAGLLKGA